MFRSPRPISIWAIDFYTTLLGEPPLSSGTERGGPAAAVIGFDPLELRYAWFALPNTSTLLELFEYLEPRGEPAKLANNIAGNGHLGLIVEDVEAEWRRLGEAGATFASREPVTIRQGSWAGSKVIYMRDPDGITIELMETPPERTVRFAE
jgi:catechol 2,3-dioxygenase-like lactoylglutathione lyase family enzyme